MFAIIIMVLEAWRSRRPLAAFVACQSRVGIDLRHLALVAVALPVAVALVTASSTAFVRHDGDQRRPFGHARPMLDQRGARVASISLPPAPVEDVLAEIERDTCAKRDIARQMPTD